jgi:predicted RNase H-like nuclease (RuvC/YqgF family)
MPKEIDMNNEEHTARKQNERIKDKEIARLRQQIAEFAQERGNFARTIFELRGIIEQGEAQTHEIGSLRDHSYKQADRIAELNKEASRMLCDHGAQLEELEAEVTRLREVLKQLDRDLESMGMLPEGGKIAMVRAMRVDVDKALAVKGAEGGAETNDGEANAAGDSVGEALEERDQARQRQRQATTLAMIGWSVVLITIALLALLR